LGNVIEYGYVPAHNYMSSVNYVNINVYILTQVAVPCAHTIHMTINI
jgi:hypothetical protein